MTADVGILYCSHPVFSSKIYHIQLIDLRRYSDSGGGEIYAAGFSAWPKIEMVENIPENRSFFREAGHMSYRSGPQSVLVMQGRCMVVEIRSGY